MRRKSNKYPFIILLIIHSFFLIYTFIKKKDRKTILVLLFSNVGFAYLFEYFVLNLFQAYKYKPRILKNRYFDNILGAILSQAIYVPFTTVFLTAFNYGWKLKAVFIAYFYMIEKLFIKWKIYNTRWWSPINTSFLLPIYFSISDKWYQKLKDGHSYVLFFSLFFAIVCTGVNTTFIVATTRSFRFGKGLFHSWKEHFVYAPLYSIILSLFTAWSIRKGNWAGKAWALMFALGVDIIIYTKGMVKKSFQIPFLNVMIHVFIIFLAEQYRKLIYKGIKSEHGQVEES